jgi:hypothetical protein
LNKGDIASAKEQIGALRPLFDRGFSAVQRCDPQIGSFNGIFSGIVRSEVEIADV